MAWEENAINSKSTMGEITIDLVERQLLPILRDLSRRGVIVAYNSGIEPRSRATENEQPPNVFHDPHGLIPLTDALTTVFSVTVRSGEMVSGRITYAVRASNGTDHQSLIGHLLFAMVNKAGTFTTTPSSEPIAPDSEVYAVSTGSLSTMWSITTSGSVATIKVTPTGSLTEIIYGLEYSVDIFPQIPIIVP